MVPQKTQMYFTEIAKDGVMLAARQKNVMAREARIIMDVVGGVER